MPPNVVRKFLAGLVHLLLLLVSGQAACATEIRLASAYSATNFHTRNLQLFAEDVARASNQAVQLKIFPNGSLHAPGEIFAAVREGKVQAGEVIMSSLSKQHPLFGLDALPFIVSGYGDARRMWEVSRAEIEKIMVAQGLQLLYAAPWPPQNLYSVKALGTQFDFKSARMRVYNPATRRIAELSGAIPVTVESNDLERAIASRSLDLMITSGATGVDANAWTGLGHYYQANAWIPKNVVFMNAAVFNQLDTQVRKMILDAAHAAEGRGWTMSEQSNQIAEQQLARNNVKVAPIDPYMRIYLDRLGERLTREWMRQAGKESSQILLQYIIERSGR
ncbi:TRAP-type C4-dicarboxylate transport system substrate-binding protein [Actimicrobium sp. GrIS 1.19]|uniref:TRAP transporter substrate-binding protein n=1 Tax=Actimicrobium sp. GrIS 1.19 TaxID=3071708 RepID=UPI002E0237AD|nr:TRAP-type C4-dicarboxylate transport system substrate-binding protein [Actimicrobium sp. GrIS 1.19]